MSEDHVYAVARPDLTQKVRYGRGEREVEVEERREDEDRGEREERIVDIYVTADDVRPGTQRDAVPQNTAQEQRRGSDEPKNNRSRVVAGCLGTLCLLLLAAIIGLVIHDTKLVKHHDDQLESKAEQIVKLQTRNINLTEENAKLQTSLDELQTRYINVTQERLLKKRLCELPGWQKSGCGCYYKSTELKNWEDSRQYCKDNQSDLMIINSKEKQDFVVNLDWRVWLGLTDSETEGTWKWVDGTPLTTQTYWIPGEPNNKGDPGNAEEDCAEFFNPNNAVKGSKGWNDRSCNGLNHWICERVIN